LIKSGDRFLSVAPQPEQLWTSALHLSTELTFLSSTILKTQKVNFRARDPVSRRTSHFSDFTDFADFADFTFFSFFSVVFGFNKTAVLSSNN